MGTSRAKHSTSRPRPTARPVQEGLTAMVDLYADGRIRALIGRMDPLTRRYVFRQPAEFTAWGVPRLQIAYGLLQVAGEFAAELEEEMF